MREFHALVLIVLFCTTLPTQAQNLINSRRSSHYTFIYKLDNDQAKILYKDIWDLNNSFLNTLFDFYPTDSIYKKQLPVGHYAFVKTDNGKLKCEVKSVNNLSLNLLNNHRDLILVFHDSTGTELQDVDVRVGSRRIPFNRALKSYRLQKSSKKGIVSALYQGHVSYFEIDRRHNNTFFVRMGKGIARTFPINHILSPIFYITNNVRGAINGNRLAAPGLYYRVSGIFKPKSHRGYIVFNKPKFKPYDTLQLKGFVTKQNGNPIKTPVNVFLNKYYPDGFSKKVGTITPFRKGAYQFELILDDSLKLSLDNSYSIEFRNRKEHTVLSSNFRYEDYELKQNSYSVRSERKSKRKPSTLYLKGEDSNGMPLYDVRADILLRPKKVKEYYQSKIFIPDTIWYFQTKLEPIGETKVNVPDSVMPDVSFSYEAVVGFSNAENERIVETISLDHNKRPFPITIELDNDSVKISTLDQNNPITAKVKFLSSDPEYNFTEKMVSLPYTERVNYFADWYSVSYPVEGKIKSESLDLEELPDKFQILASRTSDSLFVVTENPRRIPFRYFLFRNHTLIENSLTESLIIKRKAKASDNYSLSVQYIWAGKPETKEYEIRFDKKNLNIQLEHPPLIYPGQKANFKITVKDAFGEPVSDADLTAYAITKKFEGHSVPSVPAFSKPKPQRRIFNEFSTKDSDLSITKTLDWSYWRKVLGLDSIAFYNFLFPDTGYFEHRVKADASQFAPFVVSRGDVLPIQVIYVDNKPVFYKGTATIEPYSFPSDSGYHKVELRLWNASIIINKIKIQRGEKLIFSVDRNHLPSNCTEIERPYKFTDDELNRLSRHFILVQSEPRTGPHNESAYIQQGNTYRALANKSNYYGYSTYGKLVGPFYPGKLTFVQRGGFTLNFDYEPFFSYEFKEGLLKLREADISNYIKNRGGWWSAESPSFRDQVQTLSRINEYWKSLDENVSLSFQRFPDFEPTSNRVGRLTLEGLPKEANGLSVKAVFVVDLNNPDNYYIFSKAVKNQPFYPGNYQAVLIFNNEQYLSADSINIRPYGNNRYNLQSLTIHPADTFSSQVLKIIRKWSVYENYYVHDRRLQLQKVRQLYYQESSADYSFNNIVTGQILSEEDGSPLPGVNVIVKGTTIGTVSDMDGYYKLGCPKNATLIFSFIGMVTKEVLVGSQPIVDIKLKNDIQHLEEVVVVGYGVQRRSNLTGSVSTTLNGRVAGVAVRSARYRHDMADSVSIAIRGLSSTQPESEPLIILDGKVVRLQDVDKSLITAMEVLKPSEAVGIYGSRASAGVILISTRPGATKEYLKQSGKSAITVASLENIPGNSLRKNFRDYAFWKPSLRTDVNGQADFEAMFPDDVTGWNAYVMGMATKKRSGQTSSAIQSYKPLIAQIAQPHFLIQGDSVTAIGKITNYTQEEINLERTIKINDKEVSKLLLDVKDSRIDSIQLRAENSDSLSVFYSVSHNDYMDGELRKIPIYPQGVKESSGEFISLINDTTFTLNFDAEDSGPIKLYAQADLVDVFLDEIKYLKNYPYECNEQLASRLWALLLEKQIADYKNEKFKDDREIHKTIRKLVAHQNKDGSWGWWGTGGGHTWITLHVARCLDLATKEGFRVAFDKELLINYLERALMNEVSNVRLDIFSYLLEQGEKLQIKSMTDSIKNSPLASVYDKLRAQRLAQLSGEKPDWKWITSIQSKTAKGNLYWGEERLTLSDNSVVNSILVYKMLEKDNRNSSELIKIRNYFLEKRKTNWRNTYESSLILSAILPRILEEKKSGTKTSLQLSGMTNQIITKFPFEQTVSESGTLTISKSGESPVYFTAYKENWINSPERSDKDFVVATSFDNGQKILKAGKPIALNIKVEVKDDAEYVMLEVPIPAGCSYESKPQMRSNGEVHREYYNHKTNIYCQYLKKGTYTYTISLLPRYSGSFTLNPAVVACMYFPVIYGREGIKKVHID